MDIIDQVGTPAEIQAKLILKDASRGETRWDRLSYEQKSFYKFLTGSPNNLSGENVMERALTVYLECFEGYRCADDSKGFNGLNGKIQAHLKETFPQIRNREQVDIIRTEPTVAQTAESKDESAVESRTFYELAKRRETSSRPQSRRAEFFRGQNKGPAVL